MKEFLENLSVNHWLYYVFLIIGLLTFSYVAYFFFSKEGRDERGRGIFASASAITFVFMIIISQLYEFNASQIILNENSFIFLNWLQLSLLGLCQSLGIIIFKKIR